MGRHGESKVAGSDASTASSTTSIASMASGISWASNPSSTPSEAEAPGAEDEADNLLRSTASVARTTRIVVTLSDLGLDLGFGTAMRKEPALAPAPTTAWTGPNVGESPCRAMGWHTCALMEHAIGEPYGAPLMRTGPYTWGSTGVGEASQRIPAGTPTADNGDAMRSWLCASGPPSYGADLAEK